jgi:hypothetical protein
MNHLYIDEYKESSTPYCAKSEPGTLPVGMWRQLDTKLQNTMWKDEDTWLLTFLFRKPQISWKRHKRSHTTLYCLSWGSSALTGLLELLLGYFWEGKAPSTTSSSLFNTRRLKCFSPAELSAQQKINKLPHLPHNPCQWEGHTNPCKLRAPVSLTQARMEGEVRNAQLGYVLQQHLDEPCVRQGTLSSLWEGGSEEGRTEHAGSEEVQEVWIEGGRQPY